MKLKIDDQSYKEVSLHKGRPVVWGEGPQPCRIMFVGEAPGEEEQDRLRPFVGKAGKVLNIGLKLAGFSRSEVYITNVVKHRPPKNRDPYIKEIRAYSSILEKEVQEVDPDIIVVLGSVTAVPFFGSKGVESRRGFLHKHSSEKFGERDIIVTYHPSAFLHGNPLWPVFSADLKRARRIYDGKFSDDRTQVSIVDNLKDVKNLLTYIETKDFYVWDIETSGFSKFNDEIACYSFCVDEGEAYVVPIYDTKDKLVFGGKTDTAKKMITDLIFESDERGATWGGQFDYNFVAADTYGFDFQEGMYKNWFMDGMLMHCLLEEEMPHYLEYVAAVHTDMKPWHMKLERYKEKHKIKSYIDIPGDVLWPYAGSDTDATLRLINMFIPRLVEENLLDFYFDQQHEIAKVITKIGFMGIPLRMDKLEALREEYRIKKENLEKKIFEAVGREFNPRSWKQKGEILYEELGLPEVSPRTDADNYATDADTMEKLAALDIHPAPAMLAEIGSINTLFNTYLGKTEKSLEVNTDEDGRCRCNWSPQETGRYGANSPNLTNIPRRGGFREVFEMPEGWKLIEADFSQAELRYTAYRVGETKLIEALEAGYDGHTATAAAIFGVPLDEVSEEQRDIGKTVNFLMQYGGGPTTLAKSAGISKGRARKIIKKFFKERPNLDRYMKEIGKRARSKDPEDRIVKNVFGRIRHIPIALTKKALAHVIRSAVNSDAQGGVADSVWRAMITLNRWFEEKGLRSHFVLVLHDGVYVMSPDDEVDLVRDKMVEVMSEPLPVIDLVLPVDIKVSTMWESKK